MIVYFKGDFVDSCCAQTDVTLPHFKFGAGFFETLLYDGEEICNLERHLDRLFASCRDFGYRNVELDYQGLIMSVIEKNGLLEETARINISHMDETGDEYSIFISALSYIPKPAEAEFSLCVYPDVHDSYLNRYKTMNYMHFLAAKKYASERGYDDALLLDTDGYVLEASTAAVVFEKNGEYFVPESQNRLRSITLDIFSEKNKVTRRNIRPEDAGKYGLLVMNSLMGVRRGVLG